MLSDNDSLLVILSKGKAESEAAIFTAFETFPFAADAAESREALESALLVLQVLSVHSNNTCYCLFDRFFVCMIITGSDKFPRHPCGKCKGWSCAEKCATCL
jgi:hypothetical protein